MAFNKPTKSASSHTGKLEIDVTTEEGAAWTDGSLKQRRGVEALKQACIKVR
jgi:hypothetical protein